MTTSSTTNTELSRDSIIAAAMRKIGTLAKGQTPDADDLSTGAEALNNLVAQFQTMGMPLWSMLTSTIAMVVNQQTYTIGISQAINQAFPLKIIQAWMEPIIGGGRQPLEPAAVYDFYLLPANSGSTGSPSQYMYQPFINYGKLHLWPRPDATTVANKTLSISYIAPFDEFTSAGNTPYFPKEWNNALIYGLAHLLAPEAGLSLNDRASLKQDARDHLDIALDFGIENAPITFAPEERLG